MTPLGWLGRKTSTQTDKKKKNIFLISPQILGTPYMCLIFMENKKNKWILSKRKLWSYLELWSMNSENAGWIAILDGYNSQKKMGVSGSYFLISLFLHRYICCGYHSICFCGDIKNIIKTFVRKKRLIWSYESVLTIHTQYWFPHNGFY